MSNFKLYLLNILIIISVISCTKSGKNGFKANKKEDEFLKNTPQPSTNDGDKTNQLENIGKQDSLKVDSVLGRDFKVIINNGSKKTKSNLLKLTFQGVSPTFKIQISEKSNCLSEEVFKDINLENHPYTTQKTDQKISLFVKFKDLNGQESECIESSIVHDSISSWDIQFGVATKTSDIGQNNQKEFCFVTKLDNNGNIFCAGETNGDFVGQNDGIANANGEKTKDIFILKINSITGEIIKSIQLSKSLINPDSNTPIKDSSENEFVRGLEIDSNGNLYIIGMTQSNFGEDLSKAVLGEENINYDVDNFPTHNQDIFIAKLNNNLENLELKQFGKITKISNDPNCKCDNRFNETVHSTNMDANNNIYIAGQTSGDFFRDNPRSPITSNNQPNHRSDMFIFKISQDLNVNWVYQNGEPIVGFAKSDDSIRTISIHRNEIYFAGTINTEWILDLERIKRGEASKNTSPTRTFPIFGKLNTDTGTEILLKQYGIDEVTDENNQIIMFENLNNGNTNLNPYAKRGTFINKKSLVDNEGNFYIAGSTRANLSVLTNEVNDFLDLILIKLDKNLTPKRTFQLSGDNYIDKDQLDKSDQVRGIVMNSKNEIYVLFDSESQRHGTNTNNNKYDSHLIKLDNNLTPITSDSMPKGYYSFVNEKTPLGNTNNDENFIDFVIDELDRIFLVGSTSSNFSENAGGNGDAVLIKIDAP